MFGVFALLKFFLICLFPGAAVSLKRLLHIPKVMERRSHRYRSRVTVLR